MKKQKTMYYSSYDDDSCGDEIGGLVIDENYDYLPKNIFYRLVKFIYYRLIILPIAFIYCKLIKRIKFVNKKVIDKSKGYFVYANHTHSISDAFSPNIICQPRQPYIVVNSKNLALPLLGKSTKMLGALPLPSSIGASKNFLSALYVLTAKKHGVVIYPEAHLWEYCTKIRPYSAASFKYPAKLNCPCYVFTTTYQQKGQRRGYKMVIYVDGPIYPDLSLPIKECQNDLKEKVCSIMQQRSLNSDIELVKYVKLGENK